MLWVELVCDECSTQFEGMTLRALRKRRYFEQAKVAGWHLTRGRHLCPLCGHGEETGHKVYMNAGFCADCSFRA